MSKEVLRKGGNVDGGWERDVRDEVLMGLVYRARTDQEFKRNVRAALDKLLIDEYGYDLTEAELQLCREFWSESLSLSEEELDRRLRELADPIGPIRGI
jgi:hypothetical protein